MGDLRETICALATAPGRAGIAIIRISGPDSLSLVRDLFVGTSSKSDLKERQVTLGRLVDPGSGLELDEVLATYFRGPHSYTGEDAVEVSMHGSPVLISSFLDRLCAGGARLAEPGEFTMRAFLHGRMDLMQAEAVRDVIEATTLYQAQVAARQRSGEISRRLQPVKAALIDIVVNLESAVEFVEEDLTIASRQEIAARLDELSRQLRHWIDNARRGRIIRDGFRLAIVGRPNVGKSSLFNALLGRERSIVTRIPGTTRDLVSEFADFCGIPVSLGDTAGIRSTVDPIERLGVERSFGAIADADLVLVVVDLSRKRSEEDDSLREQVRENSSIIVMNKSDLASLWSDEEKLAFVGGNRWAEVSSVSGAGLDNLRDLAVKELLGDAGAMRDGILLTNLRHCRCLESTSKHVEKAAQALSLGLSEEFVLADLHAALKRLGEISGETLIEDLLREIFSNFCVGK